MDEADREGAAMAWRSGKMIPSGDWSEATFHRARRNHFPAPPQRRRSQHDQHHAHQTLEGEAPRLVHRDAEEQDRQAYREERETVAGPPGAAEKHRAHDASLARDDGAHRDDVVRVERVPHPQGEAEQKRGGSRQGAVHRGRIGDQSGYANGFCMRGGRGYGGRLWRALQPGATRFGAWGGNAPGAVLGTALRAEQFLRRPPTRSSPRVHKRPRLASLTHTTPPPFVC